MILPFLSNDNTDLLSKVIETIGNASLGLQISGEQGLGKEAIVRLLYSRSPYRGYPFIKVNCPMLSGAGANQETPCIKDIASHPTNSSFSLFRLFHRGVLYLHAIDEMEMELQSRLLTLIKRKILASCSPADNPTGRMLILSTSSQSPERCVTNGSLNPALCELLSGLSIHIPPLRYSPERLGPLVDYFLKQYRLREGSGGLSSPSVSYLARLKSLHWPGNVKQLQKLVIQALRLNDWDAAIGMMIRGESFMDDHAAVSMTPDGVALMPDFEITQGRTLERLCEKIPSEELGLMDLLLYDEVMSNSKN